MAKIETDTDFYANAPVSASGGLEAPFEPTHLGVPEGGEVAGGGSMGRQMLRVFMQNKLAVVSALFIIVLILMCIIVPFFYASDYWTVAGSSTSGTCFNNSNPGGFGSAAPSADHILGCTNGIDNFGLLFYAGRFSLLIGLLAGFVTMAIGTLYGIIAGYRGGKIDSFLMRLNDVFLSIPGLYLLLLVITIYGSSLWSLIAVIGFTSWFGVARLMRGEAQILRDREFSQASRSMGATGRRVMFRHVLPNSVSTMMTAATFAIGDAVIVLSTLGFLALALQPPDYDWGTMIQNASTQFEQGWWWTLWPVAIVFILFVLSTNYIGDALRDAFEVRLQER
ncbi:MAG TPA: ABC transporter permease [Acidimicrobiales bacterium]|jgi:peptide/nickel transport system permease protein|nr:ABC transporter permease [Acidimicrobiales bacterium]